MSFDRQAARAFFGKADTRSTAAPDRTQRRTPATPGMNAVNPGIDEHGDLYARLSRSPKHGPMLAMLVGAGVLAGLTVIVFAQTGTKINAKAIAAPPAALSAGAPR